MDLNPAARCGVDHDAVIRDMVGREMKDFFSKGKIERGEMLASVRNLGKEGIFTGMNFDIYRGEVLGFAGLIGSHRTDVALALFGIEPADTGEIVFEGKTVKIQSPEDALRIGIAYASEDRRQLGLVMPMSVVSNISLPMLKRYLSPLGLIRGRQEVATAEKFRQRLTIRTPSIHSDVAATVGRQPAEGHVVQVAERGAEAAHPG